MPGLTLVPCYFSGIFWKNVVSDFVDCQNEARWQWIKCNAALLFLGSRLRFPLSKGALPTQHPQSHVPPATGHPFPQAPKNAALEGEEKGSFILVKIANWKLLTLLRLFTKSPFAALSHMTKYGYFAIVVISLLAEVKLLGEQLSQRSLVSYRFVSGSWIS